MLKGKREASIYRKTSVLCRDSVVSSTEPGFAGWKCTDSPTARVDGDQAYQVTVHLSRSPSTAFLTPCLGEGSPTQIDNRKKGTLTLTSLLEDLALDLRFGSVVWIRI